MYRPSNFGDMDEAPGFGGEPEWRPRRIRPGHILIIVVVLVVVAGGAWIATAKPFGHKSPSQPAAVFSPFNMSSTLAPPPGEPASSAPITSPPVPSASATSEPVPSPTSPRPTPTSAVGPATTTTTHLDTGPCSGEGNWTAAPRAQFANAYLPMRVITGGVENNGCDGIYEFTLDKVPLAYQSARFGYRITYVSEALTYQPGQRSHEAVVNGRYILWLEVNAPATGYEAGAPSSQGRFFPGDHMANAQELKDYKVVQDLVFLGSDQRVSYYAFGLRTRAPFKIWTHLNSRHQVEWALMIAHS